MKHLPLRTIFKKHEWHIRPITLNIVQDMVAQFHYAKRCSSWFVYAFGLFLHGDPNVWGATHWLPPAKLAVDKFNPGGYKTTLILSRMVIHPLVPRNGASFLISASVREIATDGRYSFLMTYADTWQGHEGTVYKAANWQYEGLSAPTAVWLDGNGILTSAYRNGHKRTKGEMQTMGNQLLGYYPKHIYSMRLKAKRQMKQLQLDLKGA